MNKSVSRAADILELIASAGQPMGISQVSRALDIPKSSASDCLWTLAEKGFLRAEGTDFALGPASARLGFAAIREYGVARIARREMERLHKITGLAVFIAVSDGDRAVVLDKIEPPGPVHFSIKPGTALELHLTAAGKALLAALDDEAVGDLIGTGCYRTHTSSSISNYFLLTRELAAIRERGFAVENFEDNSTIFSLAAPIYDCMDKPAAALSVTLLRSELTGMDSAAIGRLVASTAMKISAEMHSTKKNCY